MYLTACTASLEILKTSKNYHAQSSSHEMPPDPIYLNEWCHNLSKQEIWAHPGHLPCPYSPHPIILKSLRETMSSQRQGSYYLPLCSSPQQSVLTYCKCLRNVCGINEWVDPLIDQEKDHSSREQSSTFWTQTQAQSCWLDYNLHSWKFVSVISCCVTNYTQSLRT